MFPHGPAPNIPLHCAWKILCPTGTQPAQLSSSCHVFVLRACASFFPGKTRTFGTTMAAIKFNIICIRIYVNFFFFFCIENGIYSIRAIIMGWERERESRPNGVTKISCIQRFNGDHLYIAETEMYHVRRRVNKWSIKYRGIVNNYTFHR